MVKTYTEKTQPASLFARAGIALGSDKGVTDADIVSEKVRRWTAVTGDKAIEMHQQAVITFPAIITHTDLLTENKAYSEQRLKQIAACQAFFNARLLVEEISDDIEAVAVRLQTIPEILKQCFCLTIPPLTGSEKDVMRVLNELNCLAADAGVNLSVNLNWIYKTSRDTNCRPKTLLGAINPNFVKFIEIDFNDEVLESAKIEHDIWVLFSNLIDLIGLRPSLMRASQANTLRATLLLKAAWADKLINASRQSGPSMGGNHSIF